jgi:hypothetical protein
VQNRCHHARAMERGRVFLLSPSASSSSCDRVNARSLSLCRCPSSCSSLTTRNQCLMQLEQGRNHWWSSEAELLLLKNGWCTGASARYQYDSMDMKLSAYSLHVLHRIPGQQVVFNHHFFNLEIRNNLQFLAPSLCVPNSVLACVILIWVRRFIQRKYCS